MFRNIISFKCVVILILLTSITGCKDNDEIETLKKELEETRIQLDKLQGRYNAISIDNQRLKAAHRSLVGDIDNSAQTTEEQLNYAKQIIEELLIEIESKDATINEMNTIITDQESALQEFMDILGISTDTQLQTGY